MQTKTIPTPAQPSAQPVYWGTEYQRIYLLAARSYRRAGR